MTDKPKINLENDLISNVTSNGKGINITLEDKGCMGVYKFTSLQWAGHGGIQSWWGVAGHTCEPQKTSRRRDCLYQPFISFTYSDITNCARLKEYVNIVFKFNPNMILAVFPNTSPK